MESNYYDDDTEPLALRTNAETHFTKKKFDDARCSLDNELSVVVTALASICRHRVC